MLPVPEMSPASTSVFGSKAEDDENSWEGLTLPSCSGPETTIGLWSVAPVKELDARITGSEAGATVSVPVPIGPETKVPALIALAFVIEMGIGTAAMFGPQAVYFAELFGPRLRYSGFAFARELGSIIAGGPAPLIASSLVAWMAGAPWGVCVYVVAISLVTALAVWCGPETYRNDIRAEDIQDREHKAPA